MMRVTVTELLFQTQLHSYGDKRQSVIGPQFQYLESNIVMAVSYSPGSVPEGNIHVFFSQGPFFSLSDLSTPVLPWNSLSLFITWNKDYISQLSLQQGVACD